MRPIIPRREELKVSAKGGDPSRGRDMNGESMRDMGSCLVDLLQGPPGEAERLRVVVHAREASGPLDFAHRLPVIFEGPSWLALDSLQ